MTTTIREIHRYRRRLDDLKMLEAFLQDERLGAITPDDLLKAIRDIEAKWNAEDEEADKPKG